MRYFSLPSTSLRPSVIGLGTGNFGTGVSAEDSFRLLDEFAAAGGNLLDTAHIYAAWVAGGAGKSERTVGEWLKKSGHRAGMIVATKGGHFDLGTPEISRVRPECIDRDVQESLERLQVDLIDLYFLHRDDPAIPAGEILDALQPHLRAGRVGAIGASNWSPARLRSATDAMRTRGAGGGIDFCCSQCGWSLAEVNAGLKGYDGIYHVGEEALRFHRESGYPLISYSSQGQGFFAQTWSWPELPNPTAKQEALRRAYYSRKNVGRWQRAGALAQKRGCETNSIALAYVTSQSFPSAALIGPNRLDHLRDSLAATDIELSSEEILFLEKDDGAGRD